MTYMNRGWSDIIRTAWSRPRRDSYFKKINKRLHVSTLPKLGNVDGSF